ncbi:unnamed protein product [Peniophora sp. CBMAI 1063]|nr:unnamed protein product [Peniophora sp. CBMAI 1063]
MQKLNRCQARWALYLTRFDFILRHRPGHLNHADPLSRRADHREGVGEENSNRVLFLAADLASNATQLVSLDDVKQRILETEAKDKEVAEAMQVIEQEGPAALKRKLEGWEEKDGLIML